jgi:hypothetical protein
MTDLTISQIEHLVKLDLKIHLVKLVSGLVNKTTDLVKLASAQINKDTYYIQSIRFSQSGQWPSQKVQLQIIILIGYLGDYI